MYKVSNAGVGVLVLMQGIAKNNQHSALSIINKT